MAPVFDTDFVPHYGHMVEVSPLLRRMVCDNASKFTFHGTGTYVIGHGDVAVVDPGPRDPGHVENLLRALDGERVRQILVTHTHGDHSPAAAALAAATGATVLGFGGHPEAAQSEDADDDEDNDADEDDNEDDAEKHRPDVDFEPDIRLRHGDLVEGPGWTIEALHTPGHISNHLCFALREERAVLSGDHVMAWSTTIIPPPDGDVAAYLDSLRLLLERHDDVLYPTHGGPIHGPTTYVRALLDHRLAREAQILAQLAAGPRSATEIVAVLYADVRKELHKPAARSVVAHLLKLRADGRAAPAITDTRATAAATVWTLI
jgi:glyoxylase-like metal-dependent hydrolase (beta-lactamase superfamily II)